MRAPSLFSPIKQSRYEKPSGPFQTFTTTSALSKGQLSDFRKEVRNNVQTREPFIANEKTNQLFSSWKKSEPKKDNYKYAPKSSPKKQKSTIPGGLNIDEILQCSTLQTSNKKTYDTNSSYYVAPKLDSLFKKNATSNTAFQSRLTNQGSRHSNPFRGDSPQKAQQKLERFKSWDSILDVQLKLQNTSIGKKLTPPRQQYYWSNYRFFQFEEKPQRQLFNKSTTPQTERYSLTDIVRMTSYFNSLSAFDYNQLSKGYVQELNALMQALARIAK